VTISATAIIIVLAVIAPLIIGIAIKNKTLARIGATVLCIALAIPVWFVSLIYMNGFFLRDAVWLSCVIFFGILLIVLLFIWKPFTSAVRGRAAAAIALAVIITAGGNTAIRVYNNSIPEMKGEEVNLTGYEPFRENTMAKSLDGPSSLRLENNLPRLDGATALYPVYAAFARAVYPEAQYNVYDSRENAAAPVICSGTDTAFENLLEGYADVAFLGGVSDNQRARALQLGKELKLTPIGKEAFVLFVNKRNTVSDLSLDEVKGIYSGRITNWREVGGGSDSIRAFQRPENSGSQTALQRIMGDIPLMKPPQEDVYDLMSGIYQAVSNYKNYKNAVGYSFLFYITEMVSDNEVKLLSINGVEPNRENIINGTYPFAGDFYAVTIVQDPESDADKERMANTDKFIEWILSAQGQSLIEKTGYAPLR